MAHEIFQQAQFRGLQANQVALAKQQIN